MKLLHFVNNGWQEGTGEPVILHNPVNGEKIAEAYGDGVDIASALEYARKTGNLTLRNMGYASRAALLSSIVDVLAANRERYYEIALQNSGNTKTDAALDVDGGIGTLKYYSSLSKGLNDECYISESGSDRLSRDENFQGIHINTPLTGVAVHINAFNFPSWGLWEKAAVALLSGVPVFVKPATSTALLSYEMLRDVIDADILPPGAISMICGGGRDLMEHVQSNDCIAFTGSAETALFLKSQPNVIKSNVRFNVEADSLNSSILGPDVNPESPVFDHFINEIIREMTVKAGQKCTAIRRIMVPENQIDNVAAAVSEKLKEIKVGNPANAEVTMGPIVTQQQQQTVVEGIKKLCSDNVSIVFGDQPLDLIDADEQGYFISPTLLRCDAATDSDLVHELEVFGPVSTLMPYKSTEQLLDLVTRGGGSLVASVFTADDDFAKDIAPKLGSSHGRILIVDDVIAKSHGGHGVVMPQSIHGGPGRAGGGQELGALRALDFYHQRTAVQANINRLDNIREASCVQ